MKRDLSAGRLRELLRYEPDTGLFRWRSDRGGRRGAKAGDIAGSKGPLGYIQIRVDRTLWLAHRLAWLYINDCWPKGGIDHINGMTGDNRISNLRECSANENQQNQRKAHGDSKSGLLGVSPHKPSGRWRATIVVGGRQKHLGYYERPEDAHCAYLRAKAELHPFQTITKDNA